MARGWDRGGTLRNDSSSNRLFCGVPPGAGPKAGAGLGVVEPGMFKPNSFAGLYPADESPPLMVLGANNFSFEFWACIRYVWTFVPDNWPYVGFLAPPAGPFRLMPSAAVTLMQLGANPEPVAGGYYVADVTAGAPVGTPWPICPFGWFHVAINFERALNMSIYINGVLSGAVGMDALPIVDCRFYPFVNQLPHDDPETVPERYDVDTLNYAIGPIAMHMGLMTAEQISNSYLGRRVQNIATTQICWDWRLIEGHTGWEMDVNKIMPIIRNNIRSVGLAGPLGVNGTVTVPDLSGNGNDWVIPTSATYSNVIADANMSRTGFFSDPFWRN